MSMGVYIKGFPLPNNCGDCPLRLAWCRERIYMVNRPDRCPLIPAPEHGRLIDADALWDVAYKAWGTEYDPWVCNLFMEMINNAPTIIPADKEEE